MDWRSKTGRAMPGVELRIVDEDGTELPWDGTSVGEVEARGPWITGSYYRSTPPDRFPDGWLRTGDVGVVRPHGILQITDRTKDVIKSGGEWISSVELENQLAAHPAVRRGRRGRCADERWDERRWLRSCSSGRRRPTPRSCGTFLDGKVARWWLPERWTFIDELPKTSVGKQDKKVLRQLYVDGELEVQEVGKAAR